MRTLGFALLFFVTSLVGLGSTIKYVGKNHVLASDLKKTKAAYEVTAGDLQTCKDNYADVEAKLAQQNSAMEQLRLTAEAAAKALSLIHI